MLHRVCLELAQDQYYLVLYLIALISRLKLKKCVVPYVFVILHHFVKTTVILGLRLKDFFFDVSVVTVTIKHALR